MHTHTTSEKGRVTHRSKGSGRQSSVAPEIGWQGVREAPTDFTRRQCLVDTCRVQSAAPAGHNDNEHNELTKVSSGSKPTKKEEWICKHPAGRLPPSRTFSSSIRWSLRAEHSTHRPIGSSKHQLCAPLPLNLALDLELGHDLMTWTWVVGLAAACAEADRLASHRIASRQVGPGRVGSERIRLGRHREGRGWAAEEQRWPSVISGAIKAKKVL
mmetsp:Transcript_19931/g.43329  ORF Transcript_19931/g.43329 Transcript_19931/m.43329 type:complete len:214 (+) Transcript_19931:130-771(+)